MYEYMAIRHRDNEKWWMNRGWSQWMAFVWDDKPDRPAPLKDMVLVMRRPIEDKPHMWTEGEIEEIAKRYYWRRAEEEKDGCGQIRFAEDSA